MPTAAETPETVRTEVAPPAAEPTPTKAGLGLVRTGTVLAWLALVAIAAALVLSVVPVTNLRGEVDQAATTARRRATGSDTAYVLHDGSKVLQDCGAPLIFVVTGRHQDRYGGGKTPLEKARESYANRHACSDRSAGRLVPAGLLLVGMLVLTAIAATFTATGRSRARKALAAAAPPVPPTPGGLPASG